MPRRNPPSSAEADVATQLEAPLLGTGELVEGEDVDAGDERCGGGLGGGSN